MDSNKKPVTGAEERLQAVIEELDIVAEDFLEKGKFILSELTKTTTISRNDTPNIRTENLNRANKLADVALDYLAQAQSVLVNLKIREGRQGGCNG
ncbi:MAG: hypothetical protein K1W28_01545 [Lachnospiraceae bacterium]